MAENWIKIKESLYKGAFLRNEKRGSSSESSSNRDWAEGELFRQEPLSIEIRNGTLETGNSTEVGEDGRLEMGNWKSGKWTLDLSDFGWVIDLSLNIMSVSWQRAILPSVSYQLSLTTLCLLLDFFFCFCGDHATSVSDEIDHEMKVRQNIRFFLRFFPPAHFDH